MNRRLFRIIRILNGHTQRQAAKRFAISQSAVSKLESGVLTRLSRRHIATMREYTVSAVRALLEPLGMSVDVR